MADWAVIADDLTGAADTGVQFARAGLSVIVLLDPGGAGDPGADVIVGVTDSRPETSQAAAAKVNAWARWFAGQMPGQVYKKIDSTLRGNLGAELDACLGAFPGRIAVVAPAFPATGRITVGGWHLLNGRPLEVTELANDPVTPVRESFLPRLLKAQTRRRIGHIPLGPVAAGGDALTAAIAAELAAGAEILVADAAADADLAHLVVAISALQRPVIWSGSAGLAEHLPARRSAVRTQPTLPGLAGPLLTVVGSLSPTARRQTERFVAAEKAALIQVDAAKVLAAGESGRAERARSRALAAEALLQGRTALVATNANVVATGDGAPAAGRAVAAELGRLVSEILAAAPAGALLLTGGDTALGVCRHLGAAGVRLVSELLPGIPLGQLLAGSYPGLPVVTKAGAFGDTDALCQISRLLKGVPTC